MEFARRGLESLDYDVEVSESGGRVTGLSARGIYIDCYRPYPLLSLQRSINLVLVDEAAMMPPCYTAYTAGSIGLFTQPRYTAMRALAGASA